MGVTQSNSKTTFTLDSNFPKGLFTYINTRAINSIKILGRELDAIKDDNNTAEYSLDDDGFKYYYFQRPRYYNMRGNVINIYFSDETTQVKTVENKLAFISINQGQADTFIELKSDNYILKYGRSNYNTSFSNNITSLPVYNIKDGEAGKSVVVIGGITPEINQVSLKNDRNNIYYSGDASRLTEEPINGNGLTLDITLTSRFAVNLENDGYVLKVQLWMSRYYISPPPPSEPRDYQLLREMDIDIPLPKYLGETLIGFSNYIANIEDRRHILTLSVYNKNGSKESSINFVASVDATLYFN